MNKIEVDLTAKADEELERAVARELAYANEDKSLAQLLKEESDNGLKSRADDNNTRDCKTSKE